MHSIESGVKFIGFTGVTVCDNCTNETPFQVFQNYSKNSVFFVPLFTRHGGIHLICPVCEKKSRLVWDAFYSSQSKIDDSLEPLFEGKEYTKLWLNKRSLKEREEFLKRLNSLKQYKLVKYLAG